MIEAWPELMTVTSDEMAQIKQQFLVNIWIPPL